MHKHLHVHLGLHPHMTMGMLLHMHLRRILCLFTGIVVVFLTTDEPPGYR